MEEQIRNLLYKTWASVKVDVIVESLQRRLPYSSITASDITRVELTPDEVRSAVYSNVTMWEHLNPSVVEAWMDMPVEQQDILLKSVFPGNQVYGV
jgi:hypothetical protein